MDAVGTRVSILPTGYDHEKVGHPKGDLFLLIVVLTD